MLNKNESLRDVMLELLSDDRCDADLVRAACDVIAEEAAFSERMAERQGHSDAAVFFGAMKAMFERVEGSRRAWAAFMNATPPSSAPAQDVHRNLLSALNTIRDELRAEARWEPRP
jgi:hypothetical protein